MLVDIQIYFAMQLEGGAVKTVCAKFTDVKRFDENLYMECADTAVKNAQYLYHQRIVKIVPISRRRFEAMKGTEELSANM